MTRWLFCRLWIYHEFFSALIIRCTGERVVQQCASAKISRNVVAGVYVSVSSGVRFLIHTCVSQFLLLILFWFEIDNLCAEERIVLILIYYSLSQSLWYLIQSEILECHVTTTNMSESKKKSFFATLVRSSKNSAKSAENSNGDHESKR